MRICFRRGSDLRTLSRVTCSCTFKGLYNGLIQLCDSLAGAEGVLDIEDRMNDVKKRYGSYPQDKWDSNMRLKQYFEKKMKKDIYLVCEKDSFVPEEIG